MDLAGADTASPAARRLAAQRGAGLKGFVNTGMLLRAFDNDISALKGLLDKVADLPVVGQRAGRVEPDHGFPQLEDRPLSRANSPVTPSSCWTAPPPA